jgi:hypothetical protein
MNVLNIISGCVLFPHAPDWMVAPSTRRVWETNIAETINGAESRSAMRAAPRRQVSFTVTSLCLAERTRLEARMDAALETGFGCAPLHGRSSTLLNAVAAGARVDVLLNLGGGWNWKVGDYAMMIQDDLTYDIVPVVNVGLTADSTIWSADSSLPINQPALSLATPLQNAWMAGTRVWPVIFGKFTCEKLDPLDGQLGAVRLSVTELTSNRAAQIGNQGPQPAGVGAQVIGQTNKIG